MTDLNKSETTPQSNEMTMMPFLSMLSQMGAKQCSE